MDTANNGWPARQPTERERGALASIAEDEELARQGGLESVKAGTLHHWLRFAEKEGLLPSILREFGYIKDGG